MNNTSAYANVLLRSPALTASGLTAPATVTPKRDYENDDASANFQQTFKDVRDNQKSQDDKVSKPANPKKATPVERHSDAKNAKEIRDVDATHERAVKQQSADDSADINRNSISDEVVREQPLQHNNKDICSGKSTDSESAQEATNLVADINPEASSNALVVSAVANGVDIGVTQSALAFGTELTTTTAAALPAVTDISATANEVVPTKETPISTNTITLEAEDLVNAFLNLIVSVKLEASSEVDNQPTSPQVALAEMSEASDEVIDLLTPFVTEISASVKAAPASNLAANTATNPEVTTAQVQMNASKTAFEKTLQTIITPDARGVDDVTAASVPSSSSASSATNPLMDSLMRGADQQTPAARSFVVQTAVPIPVGQPQWSQAVGEKVLWLAAQNVSSAEINLHPKDLGPMQVRVSVNQEQTTVSFTSHHAVVREVLDQNLNRLRDMFSEQGLNLVNVDVSDKSFSRQQGDAQEQKGQSGSQDVASEEETAIAMSAIVQQRLVDHYA